MGARPPIAITAETVWMIGELLTALKTRPQGRVNGHRRFTVIQGGEL
jgi:hypothetical protein